MAQQIRVSIVDTTKGEAVEKTFEEGITLAQAVGDFAQFAAKGMAVTVNGAKAASDTPLRNGDTVARTPTSIKGN